LMLDHKGKSYQTKIPIVLFDLRCTTSAFGFHFLFCTVPAVQLWAIWAMWVPGVGNNVGMCAHDHRVMCQVVWLDI